MQGHRVAEWVKHAVGLPQYVQAFRDNSITVRLSLKDCVIPISSTKGAHVPVCLLPACCSVATLQMYAELALQGPDPGLP